MTTEESTLVQLFRIHVAEGDPDESDSDILQIINILELQRPGFIERLKRYEKP